MTNNKFSIPSFQTFYVSKEESNSPLLPEIGKIGKKIKDMELSEEIVYSTSISLKFGKRIIINSQNSDIRNTNRKEFLEIVDYDPVKKVLLAMGPKDPRIESPLHWLIHHARDEVNAILQINNEEVAKKLSKKYPNTEKECPQGTLEQIKEVMKILRQSKKVVIKNQGLLIVGENIKELEKYAIEIFEELK